ncbi:hypothetical protein AB6735_24615 [Mucilaginibacter sp. RCC_168]|uniref:hypothetical protein n=1 Tax=Mucilaginibacter sp. RCC_168 TaxID=3239221 RepID=UPI003523387E
MKLTLRILYLALILCVAQSCKKNGLEKPLSNDNSVTNSRSSVTGQAQIVFSKILAKAVKSNQSLREFLKKESLKQFDNDNDILYQMVKSESVDGSKTFHQILTSYASSEKELDSIERALPLLTIFVPTLPNFSPDKWNALNEAPLVATVVDNGQASIFDELGKETILKADRVPGIPVLVVKQNERVIVNNKTSLSVNNLNKKTAALYQNTDFSFSFADDAFNGINNNKEQKTNNLGIQRVAASNDIDPVNIAAFNSGDEWQRDYVYYGLTPTNTKGAFRNNYSEVITSFKFLTPNALGIIADQDGDPKANSVMKILRSGQVLIPAWTDGNFEFSITVLINAKNGVGSELQKIMSVKPSDLFDIQYQIEDHGFFKDYKFVSAVPKEYHPNIELVPWDLENYGTAWKFIFYEIDNAQEVTQTFENSTTYAANFEITDAISKKIGLKFGASATTNTKNTYSVKTTLNSDFLGEAVLSFDQPIITNVSNGSYTTREITSGNVLSISVEPKKIF